MAANNYNIQIRINADGTSAVTGIRRVNDSLEDLNRGANQAGVGVDSLTNALLQLNLGEQILSGIVDRMGDVARMADEWNNLQARIGLVTGSAEEAAKALDDVRRVADATRTDVGATGDLYTTLTRALKSLGDETTSATDLTETISQAMALSGRSASENSAALTQLSQAISAGVLRGDEFNSMMENSPRLIQALADALGVTTGSLRAMAEEGELTADILVSAFKDQAGVIANEFSKLPITISGAMTNLGNAIKGMVGDFDDTSAASTAVATAIQSVADNLDALAAVATGAGLAAVAAGAVQAATAMKGLAVATLAARTARVEQAIADRTALASAADAAALEQRLAGYHLERAAAAHAVAQAEALAARATVASAQANVAATSGFQRLAATEALVAALNQQAIADERAAAATQVYTGAQIGAATAASQAAAAATASTVSMGIWARSATALGGALTLLKSPLNAMTGAITTILAYDLGKWMADASKEATAWYNPLTLVKGALDGLDSVMRRLSPTYDAQREAENNLQESQAKQAEILKQATDQTGLAFDSYKDFMNAVEKGALIWDSASASWRRGVVSLDAARSSVTKLDAALQAQGDILAKVAKTEAESADLAAKKRQLSIDLAQALGNEKEALRLTVEARQADIAASERGLAQSQAALANTEARLSAMIEEARAGKGLTEAKQAEVNALTEEVAAKRMAVETSKLAVEAAKVELIKAEQAGKSHKDHADKLKELARAQKESARAAQDLPQAYQTANAASAAYNQAMRNGAEDVDALKQAWMDSEKTLREMQNAQRDAAQTSTEDAAAQSAAWDAATKAQVTYGQWVAKSGEAARAQTEAQRALATEVGLAADEVQTLTNAYREASTGAAAGAFPTQDAVALGQALEAARARYTDLKTQLDQPVQPQPVEIPVEATGIDQAQQELQSLEEPTASQHTVETNAPEVLGEIDALDGHDTSSTHTVYVKKVETDAAGGLVGLAQRFAGGGQVFPVPSWRTVPGVGNTDSVPASLAPGSFVLRKAASRYYGTTLLDLIHRFAGGGRVPALLMPGERLFQPATVNRLGVGFFDALNRMTLPREALAAHLDSLLHPVRRFAAGGAVSGGAARSSPSAARDSIDINLQLGARRVTVQGSREQAQSLASALRELQRGL